MERFFRILLIILVVCSYAPFAWSQVSTTCKYTASAVGVLINPGSLPRQTTVHLGLPLMQKGSQKLIVNFDQAIEKKCRVVAKELEKMGWEMEKPKDGSYGFKPDLILEMSEYGFSLTIQNGRVEKIPLKFTATAKQIAKQINGICVDSGVTTVINVME